MMRLITGTPGAGKTLFAVSEIIKAAKEGREIFTNIEGVNIDGVSFFDEDFDWRNYPDGSLVVYDEAHQIFRSTGKPGLSNDPIVTNMDMHRHRGFDLWFITQFPTKVHHELRSMCDEHFHLLRQFGAPSATLYKWPEAADVKDTNQREIADKSMFIYPKDCFKHYKSASQHTAKLRIPAKLKFFAVVITLILAFVGYRLYSSGGLSSFADKPESSQITLTQPAAPTQAQPWAAGSLLTTTLDTDYGYALGGCVSSSKGCQCYTPKLEPIPLNDAACRNIMEKPLPTILQKGGKNNSNNVTKTVDRPS